MASSYLSAKQFYFICMYTILIHIQYIKIIVKIVQRRPEKSDGALYFGKEGLYVFKMKFCHGYICSKFAMWPLYIFQILPWFYRLKFVVFCHVTITFYSLQTAMFYKTKTYKQCHVTVTIFLNRQDFRKFNCVNLPCDFLHFFLTWPSVIRMFILYLSYDQYNILQNFPCFKGQNH